MIPTIHVNGTSREELLTQLLDVTHALGVALAAMARATPNGRDYYPQGWDATRQAQQEHRERVERVSHIQKEIQAIAQAVADA